MSLQENPKFQSVWRTKLVTVLEAPSMELGGASSAVLEESAQDTYPEIAASITSTAPSTLLPAHFSSGNPRITTPYDLGNAASVATLFQQQEKPSALSYFVLPCSLCPYLLISYSESSSVSGYAYRDLVLLSFMSINVHRKGVTDLAVHPSGRAAITVGRDCSLALINLVRGRRSFSCRLDREASIVRYECGDGGRFFMVSEERITVHDSEDAKMIHELNGQKRVLCVAPGENGVLFTSGEDRCITAWDTASGKNAYSIENAHQTRVKGLVVLKNGSMSDTSGESNLIASASSDGVIRVWDARMIAKDKPNHLAEADTKSRLTCLAGSSKKCEF
ncbi:hypothetical protein ZIOFF_047719 [Zingiber officinale]|uniref:Uncharacterized protein n=1 Tax=Zingiber officinale TaxID=94328 RepID=A0A8J5KWZ5_ZINOF|nr:hypothetical protein ZIOFF_047719 [Zingiber officinale]